MPDPGILLPLLSIVIALFGVIGSVGFVVAFTGNKNRGLSEVQNSTITSLQATIASLQAQNEAQEKHAQALEKKILHLEGIVRTIQYTLKERRRLKLEIKDDFVMLLDERTGAEISVPIHTTGTLEKET